MVNNTTTKPLNQNKMEGIIVVVLIIGFVLNRIELSIINKNQRFILDKIEELNNKLKSE